jgi:HEAT repeat protein
MPTRKYTCPRCGLAFVSRKSPYSIRCPACGATLPPPDDAGPRTSFSLVESAVKLLVGGLALVTSPVIMLTNLFESGAESTSTKTPAAERRDLGLWIVGLAFFGFVAACITFMVRAVRDTPDPAKQADKLVQEIKQIQPQQPQQPAEPQQAQAQQTGVQIIDQFHSEKAPDLDLIVDQLQARYDVPGMAGVNLPKLEAIKMWTLAPPPAPLDQAKQKGYDEIVDHFLDYRSGKLKGTEGQKVLTDFYQLPLDAVPALVRGVNLAAEREDSTALAIAKKLRALLDTTEDRGPLSYVRENAGKDVKAATHRELIDALQAYCDKRLQAPKAELKQNMPQLMAALKSANPEVRAEAANALGNLGPDAKPAIPQLTQMLKDPNQNVRGKAARALAEAGPEAVPSLTAALKDQEARPYAAAALAEFRPVPQDALGALIDNLKEESPEQRGPAQAALISIGPPAVPPLIDTLKDKERRNGAALTLGRIGKPAEPALPNLLEGLRDPDATFRMSAHHALVFLGPGAVPYLVRALADPSERVWYSAVLALGKIGPAARSAVPALVDALKGGNTSLRILALNALVRIDPGHQAVGERLEEIVPVLIEALKHEEAAIRNWACVCLGKLGKGAKAAIPALAKIVQDKETTIRVLAIVALGEIGGGAAEAIAPLIAALAETNGRVHTAAMAALRRLGTAVAAELVAAFKNKEELVRTGAAEVLARIGAPAVPALVPALSDSDPNARRLAAVVLQQIGPAAKAGAPGLLTNLKDADRQVRYASIRALRALQPTSVEALQAMWGALDDGNTAVAGEARQALAGWNVDRTAIPLLLSYLEEKDAERRLLALGLLRNMGPEAKGAIPTLAALLHDQDAALRLNAAQTLAVIGAAESSVLTALGEALHDADPAVCTAVQAALVKAGPPAIPVLIQALGDKAARVRVLAADTLPKLGKDARAALPALLDDCKYDDPQVRLHAIVALRELAPAATSVVPVLIESLQDANDGVRAAADMTLVLGGREALPYLILALKHKEVAVRRSVVEIVKKIAMDGTASDDLFLALGELVAALKDSDKAVQDGTAWALGEIDPELRSAMPALLPLLRSGLGRGAAPLKPQTDLRYLPETELIAATVGVPTSRLKPILEEMRRRRGERILALLAWATVHPDAEIQLTARRLVQQYLQEKPKADDEQQGVARLKLYKRLEADGNKASAQKHYQELIRELPQTRAAEEARKILAGK